MTEKYLSIILPFYNIEKLIRSCFFKTFKAES